MNVHVLYVKTRKKQIKIPSIFLYVCTYVRPSVFPVPSRKNYDPDPDPEQDLDFDKNFVVRYQIWWVPLIFRA